MALGLPLIAWGSAEDISTWTRSGGTGSATPGQTDPFGGTDATLLDDTDAVASAIWTRTAVAASAARFDFDFAIKQSTGVTQIASVVDSTASVTRYAINITWSSGVPSAALNTGAGTTMFVSMGNGWYACKMIPSGIVAGNNHTRQLRPAGTPATAIGSAYFYSRNLVLLDYLDTPLSYRVPRKGSQWVQSASGVEDSWILGPDYALKARARWIPTTPRSTPVIVSGWDGRNEAVGVNCGVAAMLAAGRQKQTLTFVPDRSACTTYIDSYLAEPMTEAPTFEANNGPYRTFPILLRNASTPYEGIP